MGKWICKVCGYTHRGADAPERCPQCGNPKQVFYQDGRGNGSLFGILIALAFFGIALFTYFTLFSCKSSHSVNNSVVQTFDLNRYLGKWYEIARFDHRFERDMEQCTATYTFQEDGDISIVNRGMKNGKSKVTVGKGKLTDESGVLRVSFFWPFYSDYRIMMLAPDYSYALVGGSNGKYLWILSRTPQLKNSICNKLVDEARRRGYATEKLIWVRQSENK